MRSKVDCHNRMGRQNDKFAIANVEINAVNDLNITEAFDDLPDQRRQPLPLLSRSLGKSPHVSPRAGHSYANTGHRV